MRKLSTADRYWRCHENNKTALTTHMLPTLIALPVSQVESQIGRKASSKSRLKMRWKKDAQDNKFNFSWILTASSIGHIRILGIGLELACKGGSCGGMSLKRDKCHLHLKRLPRISLSLKLVPVQYLEYDYGLSAWKILNDFVLY